MLLENIPFSMKMPKFSGSLLTIFKRRLVINDQYQSKVAEAVFND